jgi:RNA polymerase sigma-70 factor (ECF subfamily)
LAYRHIQVTFPSDCATCHRLFAAIAAWTRGTTSTFRIAAMDADTNRSQLAAALQRVAMGDRAALRTIYHDTSAKLFGICLRILRDRSEAEDVLQEVYVTIWHKAGTFDPGRASAITWLAALARNRSIDRLRSSPLRRRNEPIETAEDVRDESLGAADIILLAEQHARLKSCLDELEDRQSSAIRSAFLDGATYEQLAERNKIPLGTMKSLIRRGLLKLRACLER